MKRIIVFSIILAILAALLIPSAASANAGTNGNQDNCNENADKYAIIVGISNYPGPLNVLQGGLDLFYAAKDADVMRTALIDHGFKSDNISVLTDRQANKDNIIDQIQKVRDEAGPRAEVVFYFSGHSVIPDAPPSDPVAGLWPSRAPTDSNVGLLVWGDNGQPAVIFNTELQRAFSGFKTNRIVLGFDCCWAGRFSDVAGPGRVVVMAAGSSPNDIAGEYGQAYASLGFGPLPGIGWMNEGLFTYFFAVQGLTEGLAPDLNGDKVISVEEAFDYAQNILSQWTTEFSAFGLDEVPVMIDESNGNFHL